MRYLCQGQESRKTVANLLKLTKTGESVQGAIFDHLVRGFSVSDAAMINGLRPNNLSVAIKDLNDKAAIVEDLIEERMSKVMQN